VDRTRKLNNGGDEQLNRHTAPRIMSRGSSVSTVTELRAGRSGLDSRQEQEFFVFATASRPALGPTQSPIKCIPAALSPGVMRPGYEADHSPPSRMCGAISQLPH
jgi:hypothetical protein